MMYCEKYSTGEIMLKGCVLNMYEKR